MSGTAKKWFIGCGIGCGLALALVLGLGAAGFFGVKHMMKRAEGLEAASDSLAVRFGDIDAWSPPADGSLDPSRVAAFLEARRLMAPARERASRTFATLDGEGGVTAKIAAGVNFVPHILALVEARDRALLQADIGPGEYRFIYGLAFYGLLGSDPADGPGFVVSSNDSEGEGRDWSFGSRQGGGDDREDVRRRRGHEVRETLNGEMRAALRRQLAELDASGPPAAAADWRAALAAELAALETEPRRLAWEQGLPAPLRAALEPHRADLEASYDAMTSALEVGLGDRH